MRRLFVLLLPALAAAQGGGPLGRPHVEWQQEESGPVTSAAVRAGPNLFYVVANSRLVCRRAKDGEKVWEQPVRSPAPPVVHLDRVWVGMEGFSQSDGALVAFPGVAGRFDAPPALSRLYCVGASAEGKLHAIEFESGKSLPPVEVGPVRWRPVISGGLAIVVNDAGKVSAVRIRNGKPAWSVEAGEIAVSAPMPHKRGLLVPLKDAVLVIDTKAGAEVARIAAKGLFGPARVAGNVITFGTRGGILIRIDVETQREVGRVSVAEEPVPGPIVSSGGRMFGVTGKRLFAVLIKTGARLWVYDAPEKLTPPLVGAGRVFLAGGNVFYCLR